MARATDHDIYIAAAPEHLRALLADLREELSRALPDAVEAMMYGMPGYRLGSEIVAGYAAFAKQCGVYVDPAAIASHAEQIAELKLKATKTGVTFSPARPFPAELVASLAVSSRRAKGL